MSRVLKQTKTKQGTTSSSVWTWRQIVKEYFVENETNDYITTNKSIVVVESYLGRPSGQSTQSFGGNATLKAVCDGEEKKKTKSWNYGANQIKGGGWLLLHSEEFEVEHNADGTKTISVSTSLSTSDFNPNSASASDTISLTTIPRATACPNLDGYIESSVSISLNPASTSFKHRLYYSYNGKTGYYPSSTGFFANTGSLSLDTSFYSYTPKAIGTGTLTLYTYNSDGTLIGTSAGNITIRCDKEKCKPTITATIIDINETTKALTGDNTKLVKGYSKAQITYTITTRNGASLSSKTINGSTLGTSPYVINNISTNIFDITAVDSRGFDTAIRKTNTIINYIPLTLDFNAFRPTPTGSEIRVNFQGNYFNGSFGSVSNTLALSWKYRLKGSESWIDGGTFIKDSDYEINGNRFNSKGDVSLSTTIFEYQNNYEIAIYYVDKLINASTSKLVPKGKPVLNWEDDLVNVNGVLTVNDKSVSTSVDGKASKNLFYFVFDNITKNGITSHYQDGILTLNGTATAQTDIQYRGENFIMKANTPYTITGFYVGGSASDNINFFMENNGNWKGLDFKIKDQTVSVIRDGSYTNEDLELNANKMIRIAEGVVLNDFKIKIQIEQNSNATEYEEYYEPYIVAIDSNGGRHKAEEKGYALITPTYDLNITANGEDIIPFESIQKSSGDICSASNRTITFNKTANYRISATIKLSNMNGNFVDVRPTNNASYEFIQKQAYGSSDFLQLDYIKSYSSGDTLKFRFSKYDGSSNSGKVMKYSSLIIQEI